MSLKASSLAEHKVPRYTLLQFSSTTLVWRHSPVSWAQTRATCRHAALLPTLCTFVTLQCLCRPQPSLRLEWLHIGKVFAREEVAKRANAGANLPVGCLIDWRVLTVLRSFSMKYNTSIHYYRVWKRRWVSSSYTITFRWRIVDQGLPFLSLISTFLDPPLSRFVVLTTLSWRQSHYWSRE